MGKQRENFSHKREEKTVLHGTQGYEHQLWGLTVCMESLNITDKRKMESKQQLLQLLVSENTNLKLE